MVLQGPTVFGPLCDACVIIYLSDSMIHILIEIHYRYIIFNESLLSVNYGQGYFS